MLPLPLVEDALGWLLRFLDRRSLGRFARANRRGWRYIRETEFYQEMHLRRYGTSLDQRFAHACRFGYLRIFRQLIGSQSIYDIKDGFRTACRAGQLEIAQLCWRPISFGFDRDEGAYLFRRACGEGHWAVVEWLCSIGWKMKFHRIKNDLFEDGCIRGDLPRTQWIYRLARQWGVPMKLHRNQYEFFWIACRRNHLPLAQWIYSLCGPLPPTHFWQMSYYRENETKRWLMTQQAEYHRR